MLTDIVLFFYGSHTIIGSHIYYRITHYNKYLIWGQEKNATF